MDKAINILNILLIVMLALGIWNDYGKRRQLKKRPDEIPEITVDIPIMSFAALKYICSSLFPKDDVEFVVSLFLQAFSALPKDAAEFIINETLAASEDRLPLMSIREARERGVSLRDGRNIIVTGVIPDTSKDGG